MATTARLAPYPVAGDNNDTAGWLLQLATWVNDRPGIATLTTVQRDALATAEKWIGRMIYNTTTKQIEWFGPDSTWQPFGHQRGEIKMLMSSAVPSGWLLCNGAAVSRTTYSDLFAIIGTVCGAGDGSTTFNLPDYRRKVPMGVSGTDPSLGETIGTNSFFLVEANLPPHDHSINHDHASVDTSTAPGHNHLAGGLAATASDTGLTVGSGGSNHSHNSGGAFDAFAIPSDGNPATAGKLTTNGTSGEIAFNAMPTGGSAHTHSVSDPGHTHTVTGSTQTAGDHDHSVNLPNFTGTSGNGSGTSQPFDLIQASLGVQFMIKY